MLQVKALSPGTLSNKMANCRAGFAGTTKAGFSMTRLCSILRATLTVLCFALPTAGFSQEYPSRPIRLIVPYPPGSGTDIVGRLLAHRMSEQLGQQVFVDNRPGAGATIGTNVVAKAEADGYTIVMA